MLPRSLDAIVEDIDINRLLALVGCRGKGFNEGWCHVEEATGYIESSRVKPSIVE